MLNLKEQVFYNLKTEYSFPKECPPLKKNVKGWRTWGSQFFHLLEGIENPIMIEVGCWFGKNVIERLTDFPSLRIIAIDSFEGGPEHQPGQGAYEPELSYLYDQFVCNTWDYRDRIAVIRDLSWEGMATVANFGVSPDLIYIDAGHTLDCVAKDVETACRLFPNSIISGDDYDSVRPNEVKEFIDVFTVINDIDLKRFERFWWFSAPFGDRKIKTPNRAIDLRNFCKTLGDWNNTDDPSIFVYFHKKSEKRMFDYMPTLKQSGRKEVETDIALDFSASYQAPEVYTGRLMNALVSPRPLGFPRYWGIFSENRYINNLIGSDSVKEAFFKQKQLIATKQLAHPLQKHIMPIDVSGKSVWLHTFTNLNHFVQETAPALLTIKELGLDLKELKFITPNLPNEYHDILGRMGVPLDNIIQIGRIWVRCEELYLPCFQTFGHLNTPTTYCSEIIDLMLSSSITKMINVATPKKIFVSRRRAKTRGLINEDSLTNVLKQKGFTIIDPGDYNIAEQIQIFSKAEIVIGPHGQGMTNIMFSKNLRLVVEIMSTAWVRIAYFRHCQSSSVPYGAYFVEPLFEKSSSALSSYNSCDENEFLKFLIRLGDTAGVSI